MTSGKAIEERELLDPKVGPIEPPIWSSLATQPMRNLSDVRREQSAVYWLWRKHGRLTHGQAATMIQALRCLGTTMEAERQVELEQLRAELGELRAELQRQEQLRVVNPSAMWPVGRSSSAQN